MTKKESTNTVSMTLPLFQRKKRTVRTQHYAPPLGGEKNTLPHMTVPDESMSIAEIISKYGSGTVPLNVGLQPYWDGEGDTVDITDDFLAGRHWDSLDIIEKHEYLNNAKLNLNRFNEGLKKTALEKSKKLEEQRQAEIAYRKKVEDFMKMNDGKDSQ